jgi:hypothetical protein
MTLPHLHRVFAGAQAKGVHDNIKTARLKRAAAAALQITAADDGVLQG